MKHLTPIIDICKYCNMSCRYCYAGSAFISSPNRSELNKTFKLRLPLLYKFTDQVMEYNGNNPTSFILHGGEALLVNSENWRKILSYFREKKYPVEVLLQTNATMITDEFISLFKEFNVKIGVSLDGPELLNNQTRRFKSGKGSFLVILKNLQKMKKSGLNSGCLLTLNKANRDMEAIYNFFKIHNIPFNIRPIFNTKYSVPEELLITQNEYSESLCKLFDIWFDDVSQPPPIGDFTNLIARFLKPVETSGLCDCTFTKDCTNFIAFDVESGNVSPCNCLTASEFNYGNIKEKKLADLLKISEEKQLSTRWDKLSVSDCKDCEIYSYCYGGCPSRAFDYYGSYFKKDPFCGAYKSILKHVHTRIQSSFINE